MVLAGKNVLVTGGAGFIGSHLVKKLLEKNTVIVTDLGRNPNSYFAREKLYDKTIFEECDITDFRRIHSVIVKHQVNFVFHTAAQAIIDTAYDNPLETINSNVMGTANVLESCRLYGKVDGILVMSTDKAYGKLPRVDEKKPLSGDHPYEVSKSAADFIARSYYKTYKLPVVVTRFGNVYGEGDLNFSRIIPGILLSILKNQPLLIRSNGKYIRDYVYVKDVVDATLILANNIKKSQGEAFNISSLENLSVIEVIKRIEKILNLKINYKILSIAINEIPKQSVNFNKIKKTFGWNPSHNFKNVIPEIFDWYEDYFTQIAQIETRN
jgi:CDP-glucose 4,6-dehydratase